MNTFRKFCTWVVLKRLPLKKKSRCPEVRYLWYPWGSLGGFCSCWQSTRGPYSFVLLTRNTRLAWCLCIISVCKFCSPSLHCLIWFSRCSFAWWVSWARTKPIADAQLYNSCNAVIMDMLVDRRCFFPFSFDSLSFPARRCDIPGTHEVPLVVIVGYHFAFTPSLFWSVFCTLLQVILLSVTKPLLDFNFRVLFTPLAISCSYIFILQVDLARKNQKETFYSLIELPHAHC